MIDTRFGEMHGVLHAAALTSGDSMYRAASEIGAPESFAQFRPKVQGCYVLARLLEGRNLDFCLLFSSNASILGGLGLVAYSAANHFLDAYAALRNGEMNPIWISSNWDGWPIDSVETQPAISVRTIDEYTMTREESTAAFQRIVTQATDNQIIVSAGDLRTRSKLWLAQSAMERAIPYKAMPTHRRANLRIKYVAPRTDMEKIIAAVWQNMLGIEKIGVYDNFFELGGHSLLATRLMSQLSAEIGLALPVRHLFEGPTVADLATAIESRSGKPQEDVSPITRLQSDLEADLLNRVDDLPDEEVNAILARMLAENSASK
jgi:phthiocerol/phenolphthiocerol synthesis type-I polyketide synthase E